MVVVVVVAVVEERGRGGGEDAHMHRDVDYVCSTPFDL